MGAHLEVCGVIPSLSYIFGNIKCDFQVSLSARTFASPCFGCEPKARVATPDDESLVTKNITSLHSNMSNMVHVESCVNQQGPPCKAKYSWVIDSKVVL